MIESFEDLPVWQEAHRLVLRVYEITATFPREETYGLTSQLRRAAVSVTGNIAEAFGRYHYRDRLRFYYNARGSLFETTNYLITARDLKYINPKVYNDLRRPADEVALQINKVIKTTAAQL
jgi:four helix bundle protein